MRASSPDHATIALARCPLDRGHGSFSNSHNPSSEGTFRVDALECSPIYAVDRGLDARFKIAKALHLFPQPLACGLVGIEHESAGHPHGDASRRTAMSGVLDIDLKSTYVRFPNLGRIQQLSAISVHCQVHLQSNSGQDG